MGFVLAVIPGQDFQSLCGMGLGELMRWIRIAEEIDQARAGQ